MEEQIKFLLNEHRDETSSPPRQRRHVESVSLPTEEMGDLESVLRNDSTVGNDDDSLPKLRSHGWSADEDALLMHVVSLLESTRTNRWTWKEVAEMIPGRERKSCSTRYKQLSSAVPGRVGNWTQEEDLLLVEVVTSNPNMSWSEVAKHIPGRNTGQCRRRWTQYLDPNLKKGRLTSEEIDLLLSLHEQHGNKWAELSKYFPGRTSLDLQKFWEDMHREHSCKPWTQEEDDILFSLHEKLGNQWLEISRFLPGRTRQAIYQRFVTREFRDTQKVSSPVDRRAWTPEEDETLRDLVEKCGAGNWNRLAQFIPGREGWHCRQRWMHQLDPSLNKGPWTPEEDQLLISLQEQQGNRWSEIAKFFPGRSRNAVSHRFSSLKYRESKENYQEKRRWTPEEDEELRSLVMQHGVGNWAEIAEHLPDRRAPQCRQRWLSHLDPELNHSPWTEAEDQILRASIRELGNRWSALTVVLQGRSYTDIRNRARSLGLMESKPSHSPYSATSSLSEYSDSNLPSRKSEISDTNAELDSLLPAYIKGWDEINDDNFPESSIPNS